MTQFKFSRHASQLTEEEKERLRENAYYYLARKYANHILGIKEGVLYYSDSSSSVPNQETKSGECLAVRKGFEYVTTNQDNYEDASQGPSNLDVPRHQSCN